jgi:multiple sugar transport system ATP-binding protein
MVFQNYALYPHMNVYKNISFGLNLRKEDKAEIDRRVHEAAKILDLEHLLSRKPKELSGGQRQRVALGRAMVRNPAVFLLDEPLSNLDAKLRASMRTEIAKLHQKLDITFVYVTHDQTEAMTMGDRIVVMKEGVVQQFDTPQVLYDTPDNLFVAGFIGSPQMNFMEADIRQEGEKLYAIVRGNKLLIPDFKKKVLAPYVGKSVVMGLRLEDFLPKEKMTKDNTLSAEMNFSELMGADYHLHLTVDDIPLTIKISSSEEPLAKGPAKVAAKMEKAHFFDKDTEKAICH